MLTFQHRLRNQCSEDLCVCVCVWGGGGGGGLAIFAPLFEIWVLIAHRLKSAYMTVYVLVEWIRVETWNSHVLYLTCFVEVGLLF